MEGELTTYKVYYNDAMTEIRQVSDKDFTHAEYQDE